MSGVDVVKGVAISGARPFISCILTFEINFRHLIFLRAVYIIPNKVTTFIFTLTKLFITPLIVSQYTYEIK